MGLDRAPLATPPRVSPLRTLLLALTAMAAMPNGLFFSPWFDSVLFMLPRAAAPFFVAGETATFYLTGIFLWLFTLVLAGIPAALCEHVVGRTRWPLVPFLVWLGAALALIIPSFQSALELLSEPF